MEVIESNFIHGIGKMDPRGADIGHVHVHRQRFYFIQLAIAQITQITGKAFNTAVIGQFKGPPLTVRDNGDVLMTFFEGHFIHAEVAGR
ncbi:hypothetical protein ROSI111154_18250 [Rouxiella silvae]